MSLHPAAPIAIRLCAACALLFLAACNFPADPHGTTDEVEGRELRIGALVRPLGDIEARAVERIASALRATPRIEHADPHALFARLEAGDLHVVLGDLPRDTPFAPEVALSDPIGTVTVAGQRHDRVLAMRQGENRFVIAVNRALREMKP